MTNANEGRSDNHVPTLLAVSSVDGISTVPVKADPLTGRLYVDASVTLSSVSGNLTNNNAAPAANNIGALVGLANAAAPSYSEGKQVLLSTDLSGALRVTGSLSVGGTTDNSAYTAGTSTGTPAMGFYHSVIDTVTDGRAATVAITSKRAMMVNLQNASGTEIGTSSAPLQVSLANTGANATAVKVDGSGVTQPVSAASLPLPTGAATAAKQPALGTAGSASTDVLTIQGIASMVALKVDGSAVTQPISAASLPLPSGAATAAKQPALGTAGSASTDVLTIQGIASMVALKVDGSAVTQPVSGTVTANIGTTNGLALDATLTGGTQKTKIVDSGGTNVATVSAAGAVKVDGSGVTQPVSLTSTTITGTVTTTPSPATSGGPTVARVKAAASTNATSVKASAGQIYGYSLTNNTSSAKYFKFYNKASSPTVGTDTPLFTIIIPASGGANISWDYGIPCGTGIAYAITGGVADSDTTAVSADDVHGVVLYK